MDTKKVLSYYQEQQCARQWQAFLQAFSSEFAAKADPAELRGFMYELGWRMAQQFEVKDGSSLQALQACMNQVWSELNWGWVEIQEEADALVLSHYSAPLSAAFGATALTWTPALLEGVYAQWFDALGMDKSLRLMQKAQADEDGLQLVYELKKFFDEAAHTNKR